MVLMIDLKIDGEIEIMIVQRMILIEISDLRAIKIDWSMIAL